MIGDEIRKRVERATVKLTLKGGQGVLVKGAYIITAAHCLDHSIGGHKVPGDYCSQEVETLKGKLITTPYAIEPIADTAVLGPPDYKEFPHDAKVFKQFCDEVAPLTFFTEKLNFQQEMSVYVLTYRGKWIKGEVVRLTNKKDSPCLTLTTKEQIEGGISGDPIITAKGQLVAIVSNDSIMKGDGPYEGLCFRPHLALPVWITHEIR